MQELGKTFSDQDVNAVASQHFDAQQVGTISLVSFIAFCLLKRW